MSFMAHVAMHHKRDIVESVDEKQPLMDQPQPPRRSLVPQTVWGWVLLITVGSICFRVLFYYLILTNYFLPSPKWQSSVQQCRQVDPLHPHRSLPLGAEMERFLNSSAFANVSAARLGGAVQIRSESFDNMGPVGEDKRWDIFNDLAAYMQSQFPFVHTTLELEKVNTHGLLYTWKGTDESLKPTLLLAHQDVVPVDETTLHQWTHPPFSGHFDGKYIWGRGSSDCKNALIGIMEAVELLIKAGFQPKRTVLLSFGFDEEVGGPRGANELAKHLTAKYAESGGVAVVFDEGGEAYKQWNTVFAVPAVAEKGSIDIEVVVRMTGGHSSIPPPHTGIGVASELITAVESHAYEPRLYPANPFVGLMQCAAAHSHDFPRKLKKLLPKGRAHSCKKHDKLAHEAAKLGPATKYLFTTSQAVDMIDGGVKSNALPERVRVLINHRINVGETTSVAKAKVSQIAAHIAHKHNLTLHAFTNETETPLSISLSAHTMLEPAPVTPTSVDSITPYYVLSGTLRALYGEKMIVAPGIMTGNTDTKYYWGLSKHIFRYGPGWDPDSVENFKVVHTVNERVSILNHVRTVQWYSLFIRNMDEANLE